MKDVIIKNMKKFAKKYILYFIFLFLIVFFFFLFLLIKTYVFDKNAGSIIKTEDQIIIERIGKLVFLPKGETPIIATVSDPEKLLGQPFFIDAKKGDQVLIYTNVKKAYLYNPVENKIVNMASLNIGNVKKSTDILQNLESKDVNNAISTDEENQF